MFLGLSAVLVARGAYNLKPRLAFFSSLVPPVDERGAEERKPGFEVKMPCPFNHKGLGAGTFSFCAPVLFLTLNLLYRSAFFVCLFLFFISLSPILELEDHFPSRFTFRTSPNGSLLR